MDQKPVRLSGEQEVTMDDKGRLIVPARYRDALGSQVVLWRGFKGQVMLHPLAQWQQAADQLAQEKTTHQVRNALYMLYSGNEAELDRQGRVIIPQVLRNYAELNSTVVVVGIVDHLELWNQERWFALTRQMSAESDEITDQLADLGVRV